MSGGHCYVLALPQPFHIKAPHGFAKIMMDLSIWGQREHVAYQRCPAKAVARMVADLGDLPFLSKRSICTTRRCDVDADAARLQHASHHVSTAADEHAAADSAGRSRRSRGHGRGSSRSYGQGVHPAAHALAGRRSTARRRVRSIRKTRWGGSGDGRCG
jgi:hypothetical protein